MSEKYPYPTAEHYTFPRTRTEIIADELKYCPDPEDFRELYVKLGEYYAETPIIQSMQKYSFLMNVAHVAAGGEGHDSHIDWDFCMGTLLAVHTTVHNASRSRRERVLRFNPMYSINGEESDRDARCEIVKYLHAWEVQGFEERFHEEPIEMKEGLFDLTKHMYGGVFKPLEREQSFMSGYMFAVNIIDGNLQTPGPVLY